jgi:MoaA/NifB/PqqE/SkfB family radical SAM enzyme
VTKNQKYKLASRLLKNGFCYRILRQSGNPGLPQAISLEITHHCVAECIMCNIWKISKEIPVLSANAWLRLLSIPLFSELIELDITGGEPFLRKDIHELISEISALKTSTLKNLKSIAITTNGFLTERILSFVDQILPTLTAASIDLVIVCAVDAVTPLHDKIRNFKNGWNKVNKTIQRLVEKRNNHPNLIIGIKTTVLPLNIDELDGISTYADEHGLFKIVSPFIITSGRYLNRNKKNEFEFTEADRKKLIRFYSGDTDSWDFHRKALVDFFRTGVMNKPCSCGFNYFFVRSTGEVFLCPLIDESVGNICDQDIEMIFKSQRASQIRKSIGRFPQCQSCTEPGLERYSLPFEGFEYLKLLIKMEGGSFSKLHYQMGFDKYLG